MSLAYLPFLLPEIIGIAIMVVLNTNLCTYGVNWGTAPKRAQLVRVK